LIKITLGDSLNPLPNISANYFTLIETNSCVGCDLRFLTLESSQDFSGANLSGANLFRADLFGAHLDDANLTFANLEGADLTDTNLFRANLGGAIWTNGQICQEQLSIGGCHQISPEVRDNINTLSNTGSCPGCILVGANSTLVNNLEGANLTGAFLEGANLSGTNLIGADFTNAIWINGTPCGQGSIGTCIPSTFLDLLLATGNCPGCNFQLADLSGEDLTGANLSGANLSFANLRDANLTGADLDNANLTRANLSGANLTSADLSGAICGIFIGPDFFEIECSSLF